jgi:hypothetical protein
VKSVKSVKTDASLPFPSSYPNTPILLEREEEFTKNVKEMNIGGIHRPSRATPTHSVGNRRGCLEHAYESLRAAGPDAIAAIVDNS